MKDLFVFLVISLCAAIGTVQAAPKFLTDCDCISEITKKTQIMDFDSCKNYILTEIAKNYTVQVLENTPLSLKVKVWVDDAGFRIACSRTILGTRH